MKRLEGTQWVNLKVQLALPEHNLQGVERHLVLLISKEALHKVVRQRKVGLFFKIEIRGHEVNIVIENQFSAQRKG